MLRPTMSKRSHKRTKPRRAHKSQSRAVGDASSKVPAQNTKAYKRQLVGARFKIGDALPTTDPVARFNVVMGMISNDWLRSADLLLKHVPEDEGGITLLLMRQEITLTHEAAKFIKDSCKRSPEINAFVKTLKPEAQEFLDRIMARVDPKSPTYLAWLEPTRNISAHYPELHPKSFENGDENLAIALEKASSIDSGVSFHPSNPGRSVRFWFADEVTLKMMPDGDLGAMSSDFGGRIRALAEAAEDLASFAQLAFDSYLSRRQRAQLASA
jgi:hypothetical protein